MAGSSWYHAGALNRNAEMPENWTQSQSDAPSIEYKFNQAQNNQHSYPDVQHPSSRYTGHGIQHNGPQSYMSPIGQKRPNLVNLNFSKISFSSRTANYKIFRNPENFLAKHFSVLVWS